MLNSLGSSLEDDITVGTVDAKGIAGWAVTPLTYYVGLRGHDHFDLSMMLFKEMTKRASSEFGIRFFLQESSRVYYPGLHMVEIMVNGVSMGKMHFSC